MIERQRKPTYVAFIVQLSLKGFIPAQIRSDTHNLFAVEGCACFHTFTSFSYTCIGISARDTPGPPCFCSAGPDTSLQHAGVCSLQQQQFQGEVTCDMISLHLVLSPAVQPCSCLLISISTALPAAQMHLSQHSLLCQPCLACLVSRPCQDCRLCQPSRLCPPSRLWL